MGLAFYFRIIAITSYSKKFKDTHYTHSNITFCSYKKDEKAWKILFQVKKKIYIKKGGWHAKQINVISLSFLRPYLQHSTEIRP